VVVPSAAAATPVQEEDPADEDGSAAGSAQVDLEIDPFRADGGDIVSAFGDIQDNVQAQRAQVTAAEQNVTNAESALAAAQAVVAETQTEIDHWVGLSDTVVVQAFMTSPAERVLGALDVATAEDATVMQTMLDMQADADADVLAELSDARARLEEEQEAEQDAADAANDAVAEAESALADLEAAVGQQTRFTLEVEARLERDLGEIEALRESDPELAAELEGRASALAAQIAESRRLLDEEEALESIGVEPADPDGPTGPITITVEGGLAMVSCPQGLGSIDVAGVIARDLQGLLNLAAEQGLALCGNGWRDPAEQIALRRAHCGSSNYAIYQAPASSCSPPTAKPGSSRHEQGLAIDFTCGSYGTVGWGDPCHDFLRANASDFGLQPLSSEPWHWSPDGE
jgi:peptidoglycan hydrolase CwlO-like protein